MKKICMKSRMDCLIVKLFHFRIFRIFSFWLYFGTKDTRKARMERNKKKALTCTHERERLDDVRETDKLFHQASQALLGRAKRLSSSLLRSLLDFALLGDAISRHVAKGWARGAWRAFGKAEPFTYKPLNSCWLKAKVLKIENSIRLCIRNSSQNVSTFY